MFNELFNEVVHVIINQDDNNHIIKSVKIWSLSQRNSNINSNNTYDELVQKASNI